MKYQNKLFLLFCLAVLINITGCKDDPNTTDTNFDAGPLLKNTSENVITVTYHELFINSQTLTTSINALEAAPDASTLEAAREAWRNTRKPWEQSEGFLFGPVSTKGIDPAIDSWPVNIVDLTLDGGLGDLIVKDSTIYSGQVNEALYSIPHSNGTDYWLITHTVSTYDFMIYQISASGIGAPSTQTIGWPAFNGTGQMAANINGDKFAFAVLSRTMLFDFNKTTGILSNYIELVTDSQGLCFSPNCRYLYTSYPADNIWQFDLMASNIPASKTSVATPSSYAMQMQLAPNGKIYVTRNNLNSLAVISSPDNPAATAGYQDNALSLGAGICKSGLPNIQNYWYQTCGFNSVDGITEQNKNSFSIHPNPANEIITIKSKNQLSYSSISIYDLSGKMVLELFTETEQIDISNLDNGIYFLELKNENDIQLSREKLMISGN